MKTIYIKLFLIGVIFCLTIITSGCIKIDTDINIYKNGSADIKDTLLISNTALEFDEEMDYNKSIDLNASVENFNNKYKHIKNYKSELLREDQYSGFKTFYHISDISEEKIFEALPFYEESNCLINKDKHFFYTTYNIKINIKFPKELPETIIKQNKISITLPVKAFENNADTINEKTHTYNWNFPKEIKIKFNVVNIKNVLIVSISSFVFLFALIILVVIFKMYLKTKDDIKICPFCNEKINSNDTKCKYCGEFIDNEKENIE